MQAYRLLLAAATACTFTTNAKAVPWKVLTTSSKICFLGSYDSGGFLYQHIAAFLLRYFLLAFLRHTRYNSSHNVLTWAWLPIPSEQHFESSVLLRPASGGLVNLRSLNNDSCPATTSRRQITTLCGAAPRHILSSGLKSPFDHSPVQKLSPGRI